MLPVFQQGKSHLTISNKWSTILQCYGLTKDPLHGNYMLVMNVMNTDLKNYLQQNYNKLTWKERIQMTYYIINALHRIHRENAIHRDLHSGNILYSQRYNTWCISDLGFCGPADKLSNSIYGNLPYIAPEVIVGKATTYASDIYSIGMLMWEISSGQPPYVSKDHYNLTIKIIDGMRPIIAPGTPLEYKTLMEQCWDADSSKRPKADELRKLFDKLELKTHKGRSYYSPINQQFRESDEINKQLPPLTIPSTDILSYSTHPQAIYTSRLLDFKNLPEPKNADDDSSATEYSGN